MSKRKAKKKKCDHLYYGPKEYGWSKERCVWCGKAKP